MVKVEDACLSFNEKRWKDQARGERTKTVEQKLTNWKTLLQDKLRGSRNNTTVHLQVSHSLGRSYKCCCFPGVVVVPPPYLISSYQSLIHSCKTLGLLPPVALTDEGDPRSHASHYPQR